jgi:serine/threonine protein kinase
MLVLDYCRNGSMLDLLEKRKTLTEPEIKYYAFQLIQTMQYLG